MTLKAWLSTVSFLRNYQNINTEVMETRKRSLGSLFERELTD